MKKISQKKKKAGPERGRRVFVGTYTNEGLKFQMIIGPLKFELHKRGRHAKIPVATI